MTPVSKLGIVIEECDESSFWLELLGDAGCLPTSQTQSMSREADELTRIFVASRETVGRRMRARGRSS
jgi:four helix bundle protein